MAADLVFFDDFERETNGAGGAYQFTLLAFITDRFTIKRYGVLHEDEPTANTNTHTQAAVITFFFVKFGNYVHYPPYCLYGNAQNQLPSVTQVSLVPNIKFHLPEVPIVSELHDQ